MYVYLEDVETDVENDVDTEVLTLSPSLRKNCSTKSTQRRTDGLRDPYLAKPKLCVRQTISMHLAKDVPESGENRVGMFLNQHLIE